MMSTRTLWSLSACTTVRIALAVRPERPITRPMSSGLTRTPQKLKAAKSEAEAKAKAEAEAAAAAEAEAPAEEAAEEAPADAE